jgi:hypothetical protein
MYTWKAAYTTPSIRSSFGMLPVEALVRRCDEATQGHNPVRWHR